MSRILFITILLMFSCEELLKNGVPDCNGVEGGTAFVDKCLTCDSDPENDCPQDCAGEWGGENICGCMNSTCPEYIAGDSTATFDNGSCSPYGCDDVCGSGKANDCSGVCDGAKVFDQCGTCDADTTNDCIQDCAGEWGGKQIDQDGDGVCDAVEDIDGNIYETEQIGGQLWMAENLKVTRYKDESYITGIYVGTYGNLYTWAVVENSSGVCAEGWHVPSNEEYTVLTDYLGGSSVAGGKMKEEETVHWDSPNTGATNESGFTALPSGYYHPDKGSKFQGYAGYFWSSTVHNVSTTAWARYLTADEDKIFIFNQSKSINFSLRCIKD